MVYYASEIFYVTDAIHTFFYTRNVFIFNYVAHINFIEFRATFTKILTLGFTRKLSNPLADCLNCLIPINPYAAS